MGRVKQIAEATDQELNEYLTYLGWAENPFARKATVEEYVLPGTEEIADIASHIRSYTGPILIHSRFSGVGKTTLLRVLLEEYSEEFRTAYIGEHNVTPYELGAIVADQLGIGKSSSTKLTEQKIREHAKENPDQITLVGIDEFGLNDPDTLHVIQYLNDLDPFRVILTGMSSQWEAIGQLGSDGRAFQRRVSYQLQLEPFNRDQTQELVERRVATAMDGDHDRHSDQEVPFTDEALDVIHERSQAVPAVVTAACAELVGLAAYQFVHDRSDVVTANLAESIEYPEPEVEQPSD